MGKCVSRQSPLPLPLPLPLPQITSPDGEHHQSVLTFALSQQDLAQAHKIWQQLTASNEYIATAASSVENPEQKHGEEQHQQPEEETFYYSISRRRRRPQPTAKDTPTEKEAALLHIESLYNEAQVDRDQHQNQDQDQDQHCDYVYSSCQQFLLQELLQAAIESADEEAAAAARQGFRPQSRQHQSLAERKNNGWLALDGDEVSNIDKCL
ncbi:GL16328 [Drosophila persimilis]|uniref:GL16328 n=1 Tax=Drosophila persimilis TaxID=7234 RepID=B4HAF0_DROPE|nr:GL16328 [Drosophila persimilis]